MLALFNITYLNELDDASNPVTENGLILIKDDTANYYSEAVRNLTNYYGINNIVKINELEIIHTDGEIVTWTLDKEDIEKLLTKIIIIKSEAEKFENSFKNLNEEYKEV